MRMLILGLAVAYLGLLGMSTMALADLPGIQRDARALELYIQDRHDHVEHCPELVWEQPKLDVYKEELRSQLPEECKE
jgi:hypothetical protein